jgi:hypothetical protein
LNFSPESLRPITAEFIFGMSLHVERCKSIVGGQVFKALYCMLKLNGYFHEDFAEALADYSGKEDFIIDWFESRARMAARE